MRGESWSPKNINFVGKNEAERTDTLGERYNELLLRREKLLAEIKELNKTSFFGCLDEYTVGKAKINTVAEEWKSRSRSESKYFETVDQLGIRVFVDDLENQPIMEGGSVHFGSKILRRKNVLSLAKTGLHDRDAEAQYQNKIIRIAAPKPTLAEQVSFFLVKGTSPTEIDDLIHELVHQYHSNKRPNFDALVSEGQAYWNGLLQGGDSSELSLHDLANHISGVEDYGNLKANQVMDLLRSVYILYALGLSFKEVARIVTASRYDEAVGAFLPLEDRVTAEEKKHGLGHLDTQALRDIWRLNATNERLEARKQLLVTMHNQFPESAREQNKKHYLESHILGVRVFTKNGPIDAREGNVVYPEGGEFIVSPEEKRGIFFGVVPEELKQSGARGFVLGIYHELTFEKVSEVQRLEDSDLSDQVLTSLSEHARTLSVEAKELVLTNAVEHWPLFAYKPQITKVLKAFFRPNEGRALYQKKYGGEEAELLRQIHKISDASRPHRKAETRLKRLQMVREIIFSK